MPLPPRKAGSRPPRPCQPGYRGPEGKSSAVPHFHCAGEEPTPVVGQLQASGIALAASLQESNHTYIKKLQCQHQDIWC